MTDKPALLPVPEKSGSRPVNPEGDPSTMFYCCCCGQAESRLAVTLRKFHTGYSACCNENMVATPRKTIFRCDLCGVHPK